MGLEVERLEDFVKEIGLTWHSLPSMGGMQCLGALPLGVTSRWSLETGHQQP